MKKLIKKTVKETHIFRCAIVCPMDSLNCERELGKVWALQQFKTYEGILSKEIKAFVINILKNVRRKQNSYLDH